MNVLFTQGAKKISKNLVEKSAIVNAKVGQSLMSEVVQVNKKLFSDSLKVNTFNSQPIITAELKAGFTSDFGKIQATNFNKNVNKNQLKQLQQQGSQAARVEKLDKFQQMNKIISSKNMQVLSNEKKQFMQAGCLSVSAQKSVLNQLASKFQALPAAKMIDSKFFTLMGVSSAAFQNTEQALLYSQGEAKPTSPDDDTTVIRYRQSKDPFETFTDKVEKIDALPVHDDWSIKTLNKGDGQNFPQIGDTVTIHWTLRLKDGNIFDSSANMNRGPFSFIVGNADVIEPWEYGIQKMSLGETALITFPKQLQGVNNLRKMPSYVPTHEDKFYEIELIKIQKKRK